MKTLRSLAVLACLAPTVISMGCRKTTRATHIDTPQLVAEPAVSTSVDANVVSSSGLSVVAMREGWIELGVFVDGSVSAAGGLAFALARKEGRLERDRAWTHGFGRWLGSSGDILFDVMQLGGRFPEDAWVVQQLHVDRGGVQRRVARYMKGEWQQVPNEPERWFHAGYGPWSDGRTIALRLAGFPGAVPDGMPSAPPPDGNPRFEVPGHTAAGLPSITADARPSTFVSLPTGDLFAVVEIGPDSPSVTKVQRWTPGDRKGVVDALPGVALGLATPVLAASSASSAWVGGVAGGHPYLAHFDGKRWSQVEPPRHGNVDSIAESPEGTTWVVSSGGDDRGSLWRRPKGAAVFEEVSLGTATIPSDAIASLVFDGAWKCRVPDSMAYAWLLAPRRVVVSGWGEVFVVAAAGHRSSSIPSDTGFGAEGRFVLLREKPADAILALPSAALATAEVDDDTITPVPFAKASTVPTCASYFVRTTAVPDGTKDFDPKDLRAALLTTSAPVGAPLALEVTMQGQRSAGVYVPECTTPECQQSVDDLVAALTKKMPTKPELLCRNPLDARDLQLKFAPSP